MRLLTFSFLKNSKLKTFCHLLTRQLSASPAGVELVRPEGEGSLVEVSSSWPAEEEAGLRAAVLRDMQVLPDFVSEAEEAALLAELEPYLKRMRYEFDHWDNAIQGYRETERGTWTPQNAAVLSRVHSRACPGAVLLPAAHVLDLAPAGHIRPHVDAVRFCGSVIAGLSLCSDAVMRLQHVQQPHRQVHALLARRSLYIMKDSARYSFSHSVLGAEQSAWRGARVARRRRVAVICRTAPRPQDVGDAPSPPNTIQITNEFP